MNLALTSTIRPDGMAPVRVGMSLSDLNRALHTSYSPPKDPEERSCFYIDSPTQSGIGFMILNGRVARVDVDNAVNATAEGIHNGDSESRAVTVYGKRLKIEPHAYLPDNGHYLTVYSSDRKYGIRFETEDGKIFRYYAGTAAAISYIEGCD